MTTRKIQILIGMGILVPAAIVILVAIILTEAPSPPIGAGKCVVDAYVDGKPLQLTCEYQNYLWECTGKTCLRKRPIKAERESICTQCAELQGNEQ